MEWPSMVISLESLQPLSPDNFDNDQIATDVDKLSRSELAGKLLDHFDGIQEEGNRMENIVSFLDLSSIYVYYRFHFLPRSLEGKYSSNILTNEGLCSILEPLSCFILESLFC